MGQGVVGVLEHIINFSGPHFFPCKTGDLPDSKRVCVLAHVTDTQYEEDSPWLFPLSHN